jgi:hypothetical protein
MSAIQSQYLACLAVAYYLPSISCINIPKTLLKTTTMEAKQTQPGVQPETNDTDVNQNEHISSKLEQEGGLNDVSKDVEEDDDDDTPELDEQDLEENNITDEESQNIEWDPNQETTNRGGNKE